MCVYQLCYQFVEEHNKERKEHIQIKTIEIKNKTFFSKTQAIKSPMQAIII